MLIVYDERSQFNHKKISVPTEDILPSFFGDTYASGVVRSDQASAVDDSIAVNILDHETGFVNAVLISNDQCRPVTGIPGLVLSSEKHNGAQKLMDYLMKIAVWCRIFQARVCILRILVGMTQKITSQQTSGNHTGASLPTDQLLDFIFAGLKRNSWSRLIGFF